VLTCQIVEIAITIFEKLAWQHELYLADKETLLLAAKMLDESESPSFSYFQIWQKIMDGDAQDVQKANMDLLYNEQNNTIQLHYDIIRKDRYSAKFLWFTRWTMRNIHPYHNRFIVDVPFKDVTIFKHRWHWISHPKGMWQTWIALSDAERKRLISLPTNDIIIHNW
jgi:hypothetical protein